MMDRHRLELSSGSGFLPGFVQFVLVVLCPGQDLLHLGSGQFSLQNVQVGDAYRYIVLRVGGMEMGETVIIKSYEDGDSIESCDFWHPSPP